MLRKVLKIYLFIDSGISQRQTLFHCFHPLCVFFKTFSCLKLVHRKPQFCQQQHCSHHFALSLMKLCEDRKYITSENIHFCEIEQF